MQDISFKMLYEKSLKCKATNDMNDNLYCKYKMSEEEQVEYLKQLGRIKYDKGNTIVHIYNMTFEDTNYCVYMIRVPSIKENNNNEISSEYLYRTCIMGINNSKDGSRVLDNILLYQDSNFHKVESKYNELYKIISEKKEKEILEIMNEDFDKNMS